MTAFGRFWTITGPGVDMKYDLLLLVRDVYLPDTHSKPVDLTGTITVESNEDWAPWEDVDLVPFADQIEKVKWSDEVDQVNVTITDVERVVLIEVLQEE
jgi:hypothetical protein